MLQKLRDCLMIVLLLVLIGSMLELRQWAKRTGAHVEQVADHVEVTTAQLELMTADSQKPLRLILKHADQTVGEAANAMKAIAETSREVRDEQRQLSTASLNSVSEFTTDMSSLTANADATLRATTDTLHRSGTVMDQADRSFESLRMTLDSTNDLITSPSLSQTMANASRITTSWALMSDDGQKKFHDLLYPQPYHGRFKTLHGIYIHGKPLLQLSEPLYYLTNIAK